MFLQFGIPETDPYHHQRMADIASVILLNHQLVSMD
jgi:hypothetical protein